MPTSARRLDYVVERLIFGAFYQSGQSCIDVQRILVHESILRRGSASVSSRATKKLDAGDPKDETTFVGPMIDETEAKRLDELDRTKRVDAGAKVLCGGKRKARCSKRPCSKNVPRDAKLNAHGSVRPGRAARTVRRRSTTRSRRSTTATSACRPASSPTTSRKAMRAWDELDVGGVVVNDVPSFRVDNMPYGGVKDFGPRPRRHSLRDRGHDRAAADGHARRLNRERHANATATGCRSGSALSVRRWPSARDRASARRS